LNIPYSYSCIVGMFGSNNVWQNGSTKALVKKSLAIYNCHHVLWGQRVWMVLVWQNFVHLPNSPNFSPAKHSHYMAIVNNCFILFVYIPLSPFLLLTETGTISSLKTFSFCAFSALFCDWTTYLSRASLTILHCFATFSANASRAFYH